MKSEQVEINSKGESLGNFDYEYPENLQEGLAKDGEETVFKLYAMQRKIRFMDAMSVTFQEGGV